MSLSQSSSSSSSSAVDDESQLLLSSSPLHHQNNSINADSSSDSHIRYHYTVGKKRRRHGRILGLMGHSWFDRRGKRHVSDRGIYTVASTYLAVQHLQQRNGTVLPQLPRLLADCPDFDWSFESRDSRYDPKLAIEGLVDATTTNDTIHPYATIGDFTSKVSETVSILNNALDIVQVSGSATSASLDRRPHFARTIPNDAGQAKAAIVYLKSLGVTHFANVYTSDSYGRHFNAALQREILGNNDIRMASIPYTIGQINETLQSLQQSQYHIVYATVVGFDDLFEQAYAQQLAGTPHYRWYVGEHFSLTSPSYYLKRDEWEILGKARSGIGLINVHFPPHDRLHAALTALSTNTTMQQEFVATMPDPDLRRAFVNYTWPGYSPHSNQYLYYDAVMAIGIATCHTTQQQQQQQQQQQSSSLARQQTAEEDPLLFTGSQLYQTLLQTTFQGTSGRVAFDPITGNRDVDTVAYRVDNIVINWTRTTPERFLYDSNLTAIIDMSVASTQNPVTFLDSFVSTSIDVNNQSFYQYDTLPPQLPPIEGGENFNLIPSAAIWVGYILAISVVLLSLGIIIWTYRNRKVFVIRASQPFFLIQLCLGTSLMAMAVFPMSFHGGLPSTDSTTTSTTRQDEQSAQHALDFACMVPVWLIFLGFVIAVSALLSKTWRLNQIMNSGRGMRRIQVQPRQVMLPFLILMIWHVGLLLGMTLLAPYQYQRIAIANYDIFGRSVESYGTCIPPPGKEGTLLGFLIPMLMSDLVVVMLATYQSYKARNLPTEFSESSYLAISMASLLETFLLGGPILFLVKFNDHNPTAVYLVGSFLLCICCLTILLPVFVPKYLQRNATCRSGRSQASLIAGPSARFALQPAYCSGQYQPPGSTNSNNHLRSSNSGATASNNHNNDPTTKDDVIVSGRMRIFRKSNTSSNNHSSMNSSGRSLRLLRLGASSLRGGQSPFLDGEGATVSRPFALPPTPTSSAVVVSNLSRNPSTTNDCDPIPEEDSNNNSHESPAATLSMVMGQPLQNLLRETCQKAADNPERQPADFDA